MTIEFTIPIIPTAQMRARARRMGNHASVYKDPKQVKNEENLASLISKYAPAVPFSGPVAIKVDIFLPIPKSQSQWRKDAAIAGHIKHTSKPDIDNCLKELLDVMTKTGFWDDDSQVMRIAATKQYGAKPRWEIFVFQAIQPQNKKQYDIMQETLQESLNLEQEDPK